jgi:hypothetical protein
VGEHRGAAANPASCLLELPTLLPEATFIEAFAICQFLRKIGIHVASDLFDLDNRTLHRLLFGKGKPRT